MQTVYTVCHWICLLYVQEVFWFFLIQIQQNTERLKHHPGVYLEAKLLTHSGCIFVCLVVNIHTSQLLCSHGKFFLVTPSIQMCCCCSPCNLCSNWTRVVEEILAFGTRLRSTHCREFNSNLQTICLGAISLFLPRPATSRNV